MEFNYADFLFDNGVVGVTVGTLLGFSTSKLFDTFREEVLEPLLNKLFEILYSTTSIPDTKLLSVFIEFLVIILLVYIIARLILFPLMKPQFVEKQQDEDNGRKNMRKIVNSLSDIEKIL